MTVPCNIQGSASQLFYQDKDAFDCQALLEISHLPHPDRTILGCFINNAADPQEAAKYFLRAIEADGSSKAARREKILQLYTG